MKKLYTALLLSMSALAGAQTQEWQWVTGLEHGFNNQDHMISVDNDGNMYTFSIFQDDIITDDFELINPNLQTREGYLAKFNSSGDMQWIKHITGPGSEQVWAVDTDASNNVYIIGTSTGTVNFGNNVSYTGPGTFIVKYNNEGVAQWVNSGSWMFPQRLIVSDEGNIYISGSFGGTLSWGPVSLTGDAMGSTPFAGKLDANGEMLWAKHLSYTGGNFQTSGDIAVDNQENVFFTGTIGNGTSTIDGYTFGGPGTQSLYLIKFNPEGVIQWTKNPSNACGVQSAEMVTDEDGNLFLTGGFCQSIVIAGETLTSAQGSKAFIAKYAANGSEQWAVTPVDSDFSAIRSIDLDDNSNIIVSGNNLGDIDFGNDIIIPEAVSGQFIALYSPAGDVQWVKPVPLMNANRWIWIESYGNNSIFVGGDAGVPELQFDDITYTAPGDGTEMYYARLNYEPLNLASESFENNTIFIVYPNPVTDIVNIKSNHTVQHIFISDSNGRIVAEISDSATIGTDGLAKGVYFLQVVTAEGKSTQKIVKQ